MLTLLALTPAMAYSAANNNIPATPYEQAPQTKEIREMDCQICGFPDIEDGTADKVVTPCGHYFHQECLDQWLKDHTDCPVCRAVLRAGKAAPYKPDDLQAALELQQQFQQEAGQPILGNVMLGALSELEQNFIEGLLLQGREHDANQLIEALSEQGAVPGARPGFDRLINDLFAQGRGEYAMQLIQALGN